MDEIVRQAANALVPLLSAGVGATAGGMAEEGGARLYGGIVDRVRRLLGSRPATIEEVAIVLDAALEAGDVTHGELERFLARERGATTNVRGNGTFIGGDVSGWINIIGGRTTFHGKDG